MDYTVYPHSVCRGSNHLKSDIAAKGGGLYLYNQDRIGLSRIREKQFLVDSTTEHELPEYTDSSYVVTYFKSDVTFADVFARRQVPKFRNVHNKVRSYCCSAFIEGYNYSININPHLYNPFNTNISLGLTAQRMKQQTGYEDLIVHLFPSKNRHRGSQEAICKIAYEVVQNHEEIISSATDLCRHAWYAVREKTIGIKSPEGNLFYSVEILSR